MSSSVKRKIRSFFLHVFLVVAVLVSSAVAVGMAGSQEISSDAKNIKGWHGSEWEMSEADASSVFGRSLGQPVKTGSDDSEAKCYDLADLQVADVTPDVRLCFGGKGKRGLQLIEVQFGGAMGGEALRNELKSKYGPPTSDVTDRFAGGTLIVRQSIWILNLTEIRCVESTNAGRTEVSVTYSKKRPSIL